MGIFSRKPAAPRALVPAIVLDQLGALGEATLQARLRGEPLVDPRFAWDSYFSHVVLTMAGATDQVITELHAAAGDDHVALFGAARVVLEYDGSLQHPLYLSMLDAGLAEMRRRGFGSVNLNGFESERWRAVHGDLASFTA